MNTERRSWWITASVRTPTRLREPNLSNTDFISAKMKLIVLSFFCCCCLLLTVTPSASSAKLNLSQVLKRSIEIQRTKRDLSSLSALREAEQLVRPDDVKDTLLPHSSTGIGVRTKRSKNSVNQSRRSGCSLGTCTVHDLAHRLHQLNNKLKVGSAPMDKISPLGYGRRRRSVPDRQIRLLMQGGHLQPAWRLHKLEALLRRT